MVLCRISDFSQEDSEDWHFSSREYISVLSLLPVPTRNRISKDSEVGSF